MANLVGAGAAQVKGGLGSAAAAGIAVVEQHPVGGCRSAGELGITQDAAADLADPDVEVVAGGPGVLAAGGGKLDGVIGAEGGGAGGGRARDAVGGVAAGVCCCQAELDLGVGGHALEDGRRVGGVGVEAAEVFVQHVDLRLYLGVADVLAAAPVNDVDDGGDDDRPGNGPLGVLLYVFRMPVNGLEAAGPLGVILDLLLQVLHRAALADLSRALVAQAQQEQKE